MLVIFDAGNGPRVGLVRNRYVEDLGPAEGHLEEALAAARAAGAEARARSACPMPARLRRLEQVRVLAGPGAAGAPTGAAED